MTTKESQPRTSPCYVLPNHCRINSNNLEFEILKQKMAPLISMPSASDF